MKEGSSDVQVVAFTCFYCGVIEELHKIPSHGLDYLSLSCTTETLVFSQCLVYTHHSRHLHW